MRALTLISTASRFLMTGPAKRPAKSLIFGALSALALLLGALFVLVAAYIWVDNLYGAVAANLALASAFFVLSGPALIAKRRSMISRPLPPTTRTDPLAKHLPPELAKDPVIGSILKQIDDHPIPATTVALSLGFIIARDFFGD